MLPAELGGYTVGVFVQAKLQLKGTPFSKAFFAPRGNHLLEIGPGLLRAGPVSTEHQISHRSPKLADSNEKRAK